MRFGGLKPAEAREASVGWVAGTTEHRALTFAPPKIRLRSPACTTSNGFASIRTTFDRGLTRRGLEKLSAKLIALDEKRRAAITTFEQAQARRNSASKEIGEAKKKKDEAAAQKLMAEVNELKVTLPALEAEQKKLGDELDKELAQIPNAPADDVPDGADAARQCRASSVRQEARLCVQAQTAFRTGRSARPDGFRTGRQISGARFVVLQKGLARMERALGQFMLDVHTSEKHGYTEVNPPLLVRDDAMFGTAQLPKFVEDQFQVPMANRSSNGESESAILEQTKAVQDKHREVFGRDMTAAEAIESL